MQKNSLLEKMLIVMVMGHSGQFDKGGAPYALHPLKVMHYLKTEDEELQCIALGHDLIEDTNINYKDLKNYNFTNRIIEGIRALTKQKGETFEEYKEKIFSNKDAILVKMADLRHNSDIRRLKGVTEKDILRIEKYQKFYTELKEHI